MKRQTLLIIMLALIASVGSFQQLHMILVREIAGTGIKEYLTNTSINSNHVANKATQPITSIGGTNFTAETGLVAYLPLNGNLNDFTSNHNDGTGTNINYVTGKLGQGALFDGVDGNGSGINLGNPTSLQTGTITMAIWVYRTRTTGTPHFFSKYECYNGREWEAWYDVANGRISIGNQDTWGYVTQTIPINEWHHIVFVVNGTTATIYYDGASLGTVAIGTYSSTTAQWRIGCYLSCSNGTWATWGGNLDEFRIYNCALSATEAKNLYLYNAITAPHNAVFFGTVF